MVDKIVSKLLDWNKIRNQIRKFYKVFNKFFETFILSSNNVKIENLNI